MSDNLLNKIGKKISNSAKGIKSKIEGAMLVHKNKPREKLVPNVRGYKLEDLFVAQVVNVDSIEGENDEFPDFDMDTFSGIMPPPIDIDDYNISIVEPFVIVRASNPLDEEANEYYDVFTGFGYNYFDACVEAGEHSVNCVIPFQRFFGPVLRASKTKIHPMISAVDITRYKNMTIQWMKDNDIDDISEFNDFMEMARAYYYQK